MKKKGGKLLQCGWRQLCVSCVFTGVDDEKKKKLANQQATFGGLC